MVADAEQIEQDQDERNILESSRQNFRGSFSGHERDRLFYRCDDGPFVDAAYSLDVDFPDDGRSVVPVDVDGDGDLDLAMLSLQQLRLIENRMPARSFVRVRLHAGNGHPLALGARVRVTTGDRTQQDLVKLRSGFQSQVLPELHFGLADANVIDRLEVTWPDGTVASLTDLPVNRLLEWRQGDAEVTVHEIPRWPANERVALQAGTPAHTAEVLDGEGRREALGRTGRPSVINFWAPWCAPCREELPALGRLAREMQEVADFAGVNVERDDADGARALIESSGVDYPQFVADTTLLEAFFADVEALPMPTTLVFDGAARLRRVYHRAVQEDELRELLRSFDNDRVYVHDLVRRATDLLQAGEVDEAQRALWTAVRADPEYTTAYYQLARIYANRDEHHKAEGLLAKAARIDPDDEAVQFNLAIACMTQGRRSAAREPLERLLELRSDRAFALLELGQIAIQGRMADIAREAAERAIALEPTSTDGQLLLGLAAARLRDHTTSRQALEKALELDPENEEARRFLTELEAVEAEQSAKDGGEGG